MSYDAEGNPGPHYKEWTISRRVLAGNAQNDWSRCRLVPITRALKARGSRGPRSLVDMTTALVANNIGDVAPEMLDEVPISLLWGVWRYLESRRAVCLHAWRILSKQLMREDDEKTLGLHRFREHICNPDQGLQHYIGPLTSLSVDFVSHLVISGKCNFNTSEMMCLAKMRNLGVLELIQPADELRTVYPEVSDLLVRGWAEVADPFPLLRVLRIWGDQSTTQESLRWVAKFPSLALYDVRALRKDWRTPYEHAHAAGWELAAPMSRAEGSIMRYLMLLASFEESSLASLRDLSANVDSDLVSVSADPSCVINFTSDRLPPFSDYINNTFKQGIRTRPRVGDPDAASPEEGTCHGKPFEAWAFWLYAFIGHLNGDSDLRNNDLPVDAHAVAGPFVLPSKPVASLYLGHNGRGGIVS